MVDLTKIDYESKHISEGSLRKRFVIINNKKYVFKANNCFLCDYEMPTGFGEVLCSKMFKALGCDCVNAQFADMIVDGELSHGVLIDYYLENDMEALSFNDIVRKCQSSGYMSARDNMDIDNVIVLASGFAKNVGLEFDSKKARTDLSKLIILDYFVAQTDRHSDNIEFLIKDNKMILAPIFDNGFCFNLWRVMRDGQFVIDEMFKDKLTIGSPQYMRLSKETGYTGYGVEQLSKQIVYAIKNDSELKRFVSEIYALDMDNIIRKTYDESAKNFNIQYVTNCKDVFEYRKDYLLQQMKNLENEKTKTEDASMQMM